MKQIFTLLAVLCIATACSKDKEETEFFDDRIVGVWKEDKNKSDAHVETWSFRADRTASNGKITLPSYSKYYNNYEYYSFRDNKTIFCQMKKEVFSGLNIPIEFFASSDSIKLGSAVYYRVN